VYSPLNEVAIGDLCLCVLLELHCLRVLKRYDMSSKEREWFLLLIVPSLNTSSQVYYITNNRAYKRE